ncbi:hypothetical protein PV08_07956 [Exophiala spinifera]|uniref:Xylanolytic transcriptional activator regulatory domain-containing protein n=1 Tax=Exophiala spinifera TaxID=91928 RepID=A0A0D2BNR3_9EURO|nr:uncharacterized protein PV08_07956 [Exophiala spinifera]KIW12769.1 hypothetical protein PV08_07956 [Exophiala spinifera]
MTGLSPHTFTQQVIARPIDTANLDQATASGTVQSGFDIDLHTLPQKWLANQLVDRYMELCQPQYPFLHEATYRKAYGNLWTSEEPPNAVIAGTLNAVLSLGCHFSTNSSIAMADSFFRRAKGLTLSAYESTDDGMVTTTLQALSLIAMYPQGSEAQEQTWEIIGMMIRLLPRLRLSPGNEHSSYEAKVENEMNVRLWWACFVLDTVYRSYWGREPRFPDAEDNVRLPQALEDEDSHSGDDITPGALTPPPRIFFFAQTIRLCQLMRNVAKTYRSTPSAAQTLEIDQQILDWYSSIPSLPSAEREYCLHGILWRQCEVLTSRFLHLRVFLLTRHLKSSYPQPKVITAFSSAKGAADAVLQPILEEACVKAAIELIHHLDRLHSAKDGPHSAWWYDLKKITASVGALLLHLNKLAEGQTVTAELFQGEESALHIALKLLKQIDNSGKPQASGLLQRVEGQFEAVREKLHTIETGNIVPEGHEESIPKFQLDTSFDLIGDELMDESFISWEPWSSDTITAEPFSLDLLS